MEKQDIRKLLGGWEAEVYRAVREGRVHELSRDGQFFARAIQQHLELLHIHNALGLADLREGDQYLVNGASPLAHLYVHAAVEEMIEGGNEDMKAAYEHLLTAGVDSHHAVHILGPLFLQLHANVYAANGRGETIDEAERDFQKILRKICTNSAFRTEMARQFNATHTFVESDGVTA